MPATAITITLTPLHAEVRLPDAQVRAVVRLDDEEESAVIEFYRDGVERMVGSLAVEFNLDAHDIYNLLIFMEAQGTAPYDGDTRITAMHLAGALGAFDRAFPGERP